MEDVYIVSDLMLTHKGTEKGEVDAENTSEFTSGYAGTTTTSSKIKRYESVAKMQADYENNSYSDFGDMWYFNDGMPVWNGTTSKGVSENAVSVVIDMFSAMDGDIDLVTAFGANEGDTVVLNKAYQDGRTLTVENGKIKGVQTRSIDLLSKRRERSARFAFSTPRGESIAVRRSTASFSERETA